LNNISVARIIVQWTDQKKWLSTFGDSWNETAVQTPNSDSPFSGNLDARSVINSLLSFLSRHSYPYGKPGHIGEEHLIRLVIYCVKCASSDSQRMFSRPCQTQACLCTARFTAAQLRRCISRPVATTIDSVVSNLLPKHSCILVIPVGRK